MRTVGIVLAIVGLLIAVAGATRAAYRSDRLEGRSFSETDFVLVMAGIALGATGLVFVMVGE